MMTNRVVMIASMLAVAACRYFETRDEGGVRAVQYEAWKGTPGKPDKWDVNFSLPSPKGNSVICYDATEGPQGQQTGRCHVRLPDGEFALKRREHVDSRLGGGVLTCDGTAPLYCRIAVTW